MNMVLSQKRADKISTRAFGESAPIASNNSADGRAKNRRVEVKFKR